MLQHTSRITQYEPPTFFQDVMTAGLFKSFEHNHRFQRQDGETVMRDELRFAAPLGVLGLDALLGAYQYLDLVPMGRNEADQRPGPQAWVRHRDDYRR